MKILFLGQNPSRAALAKGQVNAFEGSASGRRLMEWIDMAGIPRECCDFANAVIGPPTTKRLEFTRLDEVILEARAKHYSAIVTVGSFATRALGKINLYTKPDVANIEHPSGLNRNLNNKAKIRAQIQAIRTLYEVSRARQA
jgi:uracil-DNA glycosylase